MYRLLFVVPKETVSALAASDKFASCCRCLRMAILGSSFFLRLRGQRHEGKVSGSLMSFLRSTTRCMAVRNSSRERPPSLLTSLSCQIVRSSLMGSLKNGERLRIPCGLRVTSVSSYFDLSKNSFARAPGMTPAGFGCMLKNCVV